MKKQDWQAIVADYRESGMTQAEYSKQRGVSAKSLHYQLRRSRSGNGFARVESGDRVELELRGGVILKVSERSLAAVLRALQS